MSDTSDTVWSVLSSCCICRKTLNQDLCPKLLPCCHSSCKDCIEDNLNLLSDLRQANNQGNG